MTDPEVLKDTIIEELPNFYHIETSRTRVTVEYSDLMHDKIQKLLDIAYENGYGVHMVGGEISNNISVIMDKGYYKEAENSR